MTFFEQGFITKCANAGLTPRQSGFLFAKMAAQVKAAEGLPPDAGPKGPPPDMGAGGPPKGPGGDAGGGLDLAAILPQLIALLSAGGGAGGPPGAGAGGPPPMGAGGPPGGGDAGGPDMKALIAALMNSGGIAGDKPAGGPPPGAGAGGPPPGM